MWVGSVSSEVGPFFLCPLMTQMAKNIGSGSNNLIFWDEGRGTKVETVPSLLSFVPHFT